MSVTRMPGYTRRLPSHLHRYLRVACTADLVSCTAPEAQLIVAVRWGCHRAARRIFQSGRAARFQLSTPDPDLKMLRWLKEKGILQHHYTILSCIETGFYEGILIAGTGIINIGGYTYIPEIRRNRLELARTEHPNRAYDLNLAIAACCAYFGHHDVTLHLLTTNSSTKPPHSTTTGMLIKYGTLRAIQTWMQRAPQLRECWLSQHCMEHCRLENEPNLRLLAWAASKGWVNLLGLKVGICGYEQAGENSRVPNSYTVLVAWIDAWIAAGQPEFTPQELCSEY